MTALPKTQRQKEPSGITPQVEAHPVVTSLLIEGGENFAGMLPSSPPSPQIVDVRSADAERPGLNSEESRVVQDWILRGRESWRSRLRGDPGLGPFIKYLANDPSLSPQEVKPEFKKWETNIFYENGLLVRRHMDKEGKTTLKLVVPNLCRLDLLAEAHDGIHRGIDHTHKVLDDAGYWWPQMREDVRAYCRNCIICRAAEAGKVGKGLLVGWGLEPRKFECIHIDFAGPLSKTAKGNTYVLSMVDRATGWVEMVATPDRPSKNAVKSLLSVWVSRYGVPKTVVSDNGSLFTSAEFQEMWPNTISI